MSGDVQPRKRKDKKRKKDELGVEEPRGTAAALGEGDVFMHSHHEHGTGGHWCAKIIFFSLLAVLVTLIGLIILENRGLTEFEANSVESRYSGVLEGWLEDAPDDDHHDEHTLELLKQHENEDDHDEGHDVSQEEDHGNIEHDDDDHYGTSQDDDDHDEIDNDDDDEEDNDDVNDQDNDEDDQEASNEDEREDDNDEDQQDDDDNSEEQPAEETNEDNDDDEEPADKNDEIDDDDEDNDNDDLQKVEENNSAEDGDEDDDDDDDDNLQNDQADDHSVENDDDENDDHGKDDDEDSREDENDDEEHEEHEEEEGDLEIEVEKLEQEVSDDDALSEEQPSQDAVEDDDKSQEDSTEQPLGDSGENADDVDGVEDEEFLEADDEVLPVIERIVVPKGKPLVEVEDEPTTAKPADTLADEEEYEKQQEALRREEAQASHVWLKLVVGGALLVATHAVMSRAFAPRDDTPASESHDNREDTPSRVDRRMTLIPEETMPAAASTEIVQETKRPVIEETVFERFSPVIKSEPPKEESEDEEIEEEEEEVIINIKDAVTPAGNKETEDKELYSDEEAEEDEEEIVAEKKEASKQATYVSEKVVEPEHEEPGAEEDVPDDVEIIDDEQLEEELEEEDDDEEEISDVDDAELLSRLEAKYGRLPEPERPGPKNKDGGNSIEDDWPGEPSDKYWRQQLDEAEQELRQGAWSAAESRASAAALRGSARAQWTRARALDAAAEAQRDNRLLSRAIAAYLDVLKLNERLSDTRLREIAHRTLDRIRFRGTYLTAEPVYRLLIRRFPEVVDYRNNMTVSFLMADRADLAEEVIKETLHKWPNDRIALAHHGFILKTKHNRLEEAVEAFQKALEGDVGPATEPRFYYHLGDSLLLLSRFAEAHEVHKRGAKLGHFLSPAQRSLYNVERLKSQPWWYIEQTPYLKLARALEKSWQDILKEGLAAQALYQKEKEGLKERGEWSQLDLFVRGQEVPGRCKEAPVTCSIVRAEPAAAGCRRGQIKFSAMDAGTHVRPHVGPTNCRLRMHLGLTNTKDTYIRVDKETRQWQVGKVFMFDDSFEHEVWHNGTGTRLVLIVDVWHPALTHAERRDLPPI